MGVELRLCHSEYGLCICDEISGGHNQHAPTNITYEDNDVERMTYANMKAIVPGTPEFEANKANMQALHVAFVAAAELSPVNNDNAPNSYKEAVQCSVLSGTV